MGKRERIDGGERGGPGDRREQGVGVRGNKEGEWRIE